VPKYFYYEKTQESTFENLCHLHKEFVQMAVFRDPHKFSKVPLYLYGEDTLALTFENCTQAHVRHGVAVHCLLWDVHWVLERVAQVDARCLWLCRRGRRSFFFAMFSFCYVFGFVGEGDGLNS
jgi:hypothetical protein